jgi:ribosomal protein S18 acetylase RimI-like enzyme
LTDGDGARPAADGAMREAGQGDVATLVGLMREFYAESGYVLVEPQATAAFEALMARPESGRIWLAEPDGEPVGYVVVTFVFAMEHGGLAAVVDDFYVRPKARGEGVGKAALAAVRRACEALGARAMRVEVGVNNVRAQAVYRSAGFEPFPDRALMQVSLAPPSHET